MAVLMIYDHDDTYPDTNLDLKLSYKKGYVVETFDELEIGYSAVSPFVALTISDKSKDEIISKYMQPWVRQIAYNIVSYNAATDMWRLALYVTNPGASGIGEATQYTLDAVGNFISEWGGSNATVVGQTLEFDISVFSAVTSKIFWNCDARQIIFSEVSYDQTSGVHVITANYDALMNNQYGPTSLFMQNNLSQAMTLAYYIKILKHHQNEITFYVHRDAIVQKFQDDLKKLSEDVVCLRRYFFSSDGVDAIIASPGRTLSVDTEASISSYIVDRLV